MKIKKRFSLAQVKTFISLSEDTNPIHDKIVPGFLTGSLIGGLIGSNYPGAIYIHQDIQFVNPVYVGDEVTAEIELVSIRQDKPIATFKTTVYKDKEIVISGTAIIKL